MKKPSERNWTKFNGKIKKFIDRIHNKRIEFDEQGNIIKQGKV